MRRAPWGLVLLALLLAPRSWGEGVDWQRQVLQVTGNGPPDVKAANPSQARHAAERSAREDALARLLEQARRLPLRADRTVGEELAREETRRQVENVLRGYKVLQRRYYSDGGMRLEVELPLGPLTSVLVAPEPAAPAASSETDAGTKLEASADYTGLVVDARKLGMHPALAPRLLDARGQRLYGAASLSSEAWKSTGVAGFFPSLAEARKVSGVGDKPLVLEARKLEGSDLQLGEDADKALAQLSPRVLAEGRVAILIR